MRIALVHNKKAGSGTYSENDLLQIFHELGYTAEAYSRDSTGLLNALNSRPEVVVVSGGDGTVATVAIALCDTDTPIFVLPTGTANNIASSVGAASATIRALAGRLPSARMARLDVGAITGEGYEARFVEAAGAGVIGTMLDREKSRLDELWRRLRGWASRDSNHWESTARYVAHLLRREKPRWFNILADGRDLSGEYVTAEVMNIRAIGPRIVLAPNADPGDGWLDLVLVTPQERRALADHIEACGPSEATPSSPAIRVRHVELDWPDRSTHVDDERWPKPGKPRPRRVTITLTGAVNLLVPE